MTTRAAKQTLNIRTADVNVSNLRAVDNKDGTHGLVGYAIVFNQPSTPLKIQGTNQTFIEYIDPHALDGVDLGNLVLIYAHNANEVLARVDAHTLTTQIDSKGLKFTATLPDTTLANDVVANINAGNLRGCSFGFDIAPSGDSWSVNSDGQRVHYVAKVARVAELTITAYPAYQQTSVTVQRDCLNYIKKEEVNNMANKSENHEENKDQINDDLTSAVTTLRDAINNFSSRFKRDDDDIDDSDVDTDVDTADDVDDVDETDDNKSAKPSSLNDNGDGNNNSAQNGNDDQPADSASSDNSNETDNGDKSNAEDSHQNDNDDENKGGNNNMIDITPNDEQKRDVLTEMVLNRDEYKRTGALPRATYTRDTTTTTSTAGQVSLDAQGKFFLPQNILKAYQEEHQFARLNSFINAQTVDLPTGKVPYFSENTAVAQTRKEFDKAGDFSMTNATFVNYDVDAYSAQIRFSREQIAAQKGGNTDLMQIAQQQMSSIQDNTDDQIIAQGLLNASGANNVTAKDAIADMKTVLNVNLQPQDSENSQIVLTQSAYNALDQLTDAYGRPLLQPDPTSATSDLLFGKHVIKVADTLLGSKVGDKVAVIAPLSKVVYKFTLDRVQGQFIDNFSQFDVILGIMFMQDIVTVRPDLINVIKLPDKALAASNNAVAAK